MNYIPAIGLEIHAELKTKTKMFCDSANDPNETHPNINICPICLGYPGALPVVNQEAVKKIVEVGVALNGVVAALAQFDRKNYFYPDLPKGYQISQYQSPLVKGGYLDIKTTAAAQDGEFPISNFQLSNKSQFQNSKFQARRVRIRRIHLEEDTGRLIHDPKTRTTLIDFNRAGVPLMELVTEPDLETAEEVKNFGEALQQILRYLGASDADMEKGQMRVEVNISLAPAGSENLGTKVELKNINSFKFAADAVDYEIKRQSSLLDRGEKIHHETRGWDEKKQTTVAQRHKEESQDYRYFPEPDIPPLKLPPEYIEEIRSSITELPNAKLQRFREEFGIGEKMASVIVKSKNTAAFFEAAASELNEWLSSRGEVLNQRPLQLAANYLTTDLAKLLDSTGTPIAETLVTPENFAELVTYIYEGKISSKAAKEVLKEMFSSGADPSVIVDERKLWQVSEGGELAAAVEKTITTNTKAVEDYRAGKTQTLQFLVGQVMKKAKGANPETVRKLLEEKLK